MPLAGAATLGELLTVRLTMVPSPYVAENHQEKNARALEKEGGCRRFCSKDANPQVLYDEIRDLLSDRDRLPAAGWGTTEKQSWRRFARCKREDLSGNPLGNRKPWQK